MDQNIPDVSTITAAVKPIFPNPPEIAMVLGSGLGTFADQLEDRRAVLTQDIPNYPQSTVAGHKGAVISGKLHGKRLICFQGRIHLYEGYSVDQIVLPIRLARELGAKRLILTNAAGGINQHLEPGSLMLIRDHIDLQFRRRIRPGLRESNTPLDIERQPLFVQPTPYSADLRKIAKSVALQLGIGLFPGVLSALTGPSYETPAEVRMQGIMGGDAACMSTVAEAIEGARLGMDVLGISCITNRAAGLHHAPLNHEEVIEVAARVKDDFIALLEGIIEKI
ncbi:purine-nucleoside phosphorylase [candidate division LCP-89 bacterium B3_LCP]|uniref:Purine nucleoside phosphorylase n=1 Tax=candidate division LCP-89 bacterium B3_LCP TaxID=2012998 RepID=A0A532V264_UNCL8|nr:MAG: purine-nucleoside phosphorylase [candidate division LCP-89 bacterium B3_LCP]